MLIVDGNSFDIALGVVLGVGSPQETGKLVWMCIYRSETMEILKHFQQDEAVHTHREMNHPKRAINNYSFIYNELEKLSVAWH